MVSKGQSESWIIDVCIHLLMNARMRFEELEVVQTLLQDIVSAQYLDSR